MKSIRFAWLLCAAFCPSPLGAAEYDRFQAYHQVSATEIALLDDLQDGTLDHGSLIESALVAAGHDDPAGIATIQQRFQLIVYRCQSSVNADGVDRAKAILESMHAALQWGDFQPALSDVGKTITQGHFNCLTATILYQALCAEFNVEARAEWVPAHVRCWLPNRQLGIETTSGTWQAELAQTGRLLTTAELLGKVFYNRGVGLLHEQQYAPALVATWASCCLDPLDDQAGANLRACLNNWALACAERGDTEKARELLQQGLQIDPSYSPFFRNQRYIRPAGSSPGGVMATFD